jgi:hypothetical protein
MPASRPQSLQTTQPVGPRSRPAIQQQPAAEDQGSRNHNQQTNATFMQNTKQNTKLSQPQTQEGLPKEYKLPKRGNRLLQQTQSKKQAYQQALAIRQENIQQNEQQHPATQTSNTKQHSNRQ